MEAITSFHTEKFCRMVIACTAPMQQHLPVPDLYYINTCFNSFSLALMTGNSRTSLASLQ